MAAVTRFEDLLVWQKARVLCRDVYRLSAIGGWARDFALRDQIRKAAISVMSNIAEGFERNADGQYVYFLNVAKGSVGELRSQLYVALDQAYVSETDFRSAFGLAEEISRMLFSLVKHVEARRDG